jgi:hypothetical protein
MKKPPDSKEIAQNLTSLKDLLPQLRNPKDWQNFARVNPEIATSRHILENDNPVATFMDLEGKRAVKWAKNPAFNSASRLVAYQLSQDPYLKQGQAIWAGLRQADKLTKRNCLEKESEEKERVSSGGNPNSCGGESGDGALPPGKGDQTEGGS